jgi:hypothetical protein
MSSHWWKSQGDQNVLDPDALQISCRVFVVWLERVGEMISHSVYFDIHSHFTYSRFRISLLSLVSILLRIIVIQLAYGHSKLVTVSADRITHEFQKGAFKN